LFEIMAMIMPDGFYPRKTFLKPFFDAAGPEPGYFKLRTKCQQSGAPTCSRFMVANSYEKPMKIGAPNPEV